MTMEKLTKTEWLLLAVTGVFLCALLALSAHDRKTLATEPIETAVDVPQEEILPDLSPLNLNTATAEDLTLLPGIGEGLAERIVKYREANGPFESVEELMEVSGIGEAKFAALEGRVTVGEETP